MPAFCSFADKQLTVRNTDTGESFEVSVPDELKISVQEYNSDWLDSIPYLVEHARWKEPWAYEALAECYRYGKGGVGKSMFNAILCYEEAGKSALKIADAAYKSDPADEFGLFNHLMEELDKKRIPDDEVVRLVDGMTTPKPGWIVFLADILRQQHKDREEYIKARLTPDLDCDEYLIGFMCLVMEDDLIFDKTFDDVTGDYMERAGVFGEKLPGIYDVVAERMWRKYYGNTYSGNTDDTEKYLSIALESMRRADQAGFLSRHNMALLLNFCEENGIDSRIQFSEEDLARFKAICPKEYRDNTESTSAVEEAVVEEDESPVELIEE